MSTRAIVHDLRERERWVRELFSNPNVTRLHKLVLVALIWCAAGKAITRYAPRGSDALRTGIHAGRRGGGRA